MAKDRKKSVAAWFEANVIQIVIVSSCLMGAIALFAVIKYAVNFYNFDLSNNPADWGTFGDYMGGVLNPLIAFVTLIVTILIAIKVNEIGNKNHEEATNNQVKPLLAIGDGDFFSADVSRIGLTANSDYYSYDAPENPATSFEYIHKEPFFLKVHNFGLGVAIGAKCTFEINAHQCVQAVEFDGGNIKITSRIWTNDEGQEKISTNYNIEGREQGGSVTATKTTKWLGLINNSKEDAIALYMPHDLMGLFQLFNLKRIDSRGDKQFPIIKLTIDYKNIYGQQLQVMFNVYLFPIHDYEAVTRFRLAVEEIEGLQNSQS